MPGTDTIETVFERSGILFPGLPVLPYGVERHPVPGGGSRTVQIQVGDEIIVQDPEGLQPVELVFFGTDGKSDAGMIGALGVGRPDGTISVMQGGSRSGAQTLRKLRALGIDLAIGDAVPALGNGSRPGERQSFTADSDGVLIVSAPGGPMLPEKQDAPTEVTLFIRRAVPGPGKGGLAPPDPLADPLSDVNIQPGEAYPYIVRKGEFIQILDVQGRECSDFQAFSLRALERGLEREIDPTTTRSLVGSAYPAPGIFSKYFTVDFEPLVEIVQDSCGRHDAFGLACTARYYEDLGYPGHVNCSDNINAGLADYDVRPRGGWPAINFFFNTGIDDSNSVMLDEPWSRPGDFVLLRALTDLVCVSTACPCDVDAANGWNPTDIQLRVYGADEDFTPSVGYRKSAEAEMQETKKTGFHDCFARHTRDFVEYSGYWLPNSMSGQGALDAYWGCRERVAVMDLSPLRKYEVTGPDAEALMQLCVTRNVKRLAVGEVVYTAMCYRHGGMIDDGTLFRLGNDNFRWIGGNDTSGLWLREQAEIRAFNAWVRNSTDQLHNIAVQGPNSRATLESIFWTAPTQPTLAELGWFRFTIARLGDFNGAACVISRTGYTGELGYEIFCHPKDAVEIFDAVWQSGLEFGIVPLGLDALDMLRIEAGLIFAGCEFTDQINPFEAGIGFTVPLKTQNDDFIGRAALEERKAHPVRQLVGLEIESGHVPATGDCIRMGRAQIGEITSAVRSPILGRTIALARMDSVHSEIGTELEVGQLDGQQKRLRARIVRFPHFDPEKKRARDIA
ncbi:MAG: DUF1989 domain-containing protein [Rhodobacteraceae bacterium]|nr:DUF1989 domain-containing protein [Paracoccaceae bacterium]